MHFHRVEKISLLLTETGFSEVSIEVLPGVELEEFYELHTAIMESYVKKTGDRELRKILEEFRSVVLKYGEFSTTIALIKAVKGAKS